MGFFHDLFSVVWKIHLFLFFQTFSGKLPENGKKSIYFYFPEKSKYFIYE